MSRMTRFLGDTPLRVFFRLLILSFIVGLGLAALNIHPFELYDWLQRVALRIYDMGFEAFERAFGYLILGAMIVIPVFLLMRVFKVGRGN
ncbi:MAG: DUF6460 domain-containing protein [Alphaproteobacteria bacterium]